MLRAIGVAMIFSICVAAAPIASPLPRAIEPQDSTSALRSKFVHESDPARKAKLLVQLGDAEFRDIQKDVGADNLSEALATVQQYRDEAQLCQKALEATGQDPEKHPNGFKQLQISLRESLRRLDAIIVEIPGDEQKPFRDLRHDLDEMDRKLIHQLFPRRPEPEQESQPGKPKSQG